MTSLCSKVLLDKLLTDNSKGWKVDLFITDVSARDELICGLCSNVCKSAVEFDCDIDHDEKDIKSYCECCIKQALEENGNKCLISMHDSPKYASCRGYRRVILKMQVLCPYSTKYKNKQSGTIQTDDGCSFTGSLAQLIQDHIQGCMKQRMKSKASSNINNSDGIQSLIMEDLQQKYEQIANDVHSLRMMFSINYNLKLISVKFNPKTLKTLFVEWMTNKTSNVDIVYNLEFKKLISNSNMEQKSNGEESSNNFKGNDWQFVSKLNKDQNMQVIEDENEYFLMGEQYMFRINVCVNSLMNDMQLYSNVLQTGCSPFHFHSSILKPMENHNLYHMLADVYKGKFHLLFRASRDGFTSQAFHNKCDGQSPTITIVHSEFDHVFGGFTPAKWHSKNTCITDPSLDSFLFILRTKREKDMKKIPIKIMSKAQYVIYGGDNYGPIFGHSSYEFILHNNCDTSNSSYSLMGHTGYYNSPNDKEMLAGAYNFKVNDYEVWQIILE